MAPALSWEGLFGSLILVLLGILAFLAVVTGSVGAVLYVFASGIQSILGAAPPDVGGFFLIVGSAVTILTFASLSSR